MIFYEPARTLQLRGIGKNTKNRRAASGHGGGAGAILQKALLDVSKPGMPGENNLLKVVFAGGDTILGETGRAALNHSPNLSLESI